MIWVLWSFLGVVAICSLGLSVNMGVAADRARSAGAIRIQLASVALSMICGAAALLCAFSLGQTIPAG